MEFIDFPFSTIEMSTQRDISPPSKTIGKNKERDSSGDTPQATKVKTGDTLDVPIPNVPTFPSTTGGTELQQLMEFMQRDSVKRDEQHQQIVSGMSTLTNALNEVKTGLANETQERKAETKELREKIESVEKRDQTVVTNMVKASLEQINGVGKSDETPRENQIIVSGWTEGEDADKVIAEIEKVLAEGTRRRRVVKVETWEDPSTFGVITFDNPLAKFGFFKKMKSVEIKTSQNKTMVFRSNEDYETRLRNKFLGQVKCKMHEKKGVALEKIKIDRRGKQVTMDGVRIAYVDEAGHFKYEGAAGDVKADVDGFMKDWQDKRNQ